MTELPNYVLERTFDAPRELVWKAWTDPELLPRWYGPRVETIIHRLDVEPGGLWLGEMKWGENANYFRSEYLEVTPPEKLVMVQATADADWNIIASPMMQDWPKLMHTTVTFDERDGKTHMRLTWVPHEATQAELACFAASIDNLGKGWGAGMELLAALLIELQAKS